jgi:phosphopantetheinyl transferase (holo-ACP synthase)
MPRFPFPIQIGTDICHIPRILAILRKNHGAAFVKKILRPEERAQCDKRVNVPLLKLNAIEKARKLAGWKTVGIEKNTTQCLTDSKDNKRSKKGILGTLKDSLEETSRQAVNERALKEIILPERVSQDNSSSNSVNAAKAATLDLFESAESVIRKSDDTRNQTLGCAADVSQSMEDIKRRTEALEPDLRKAAEFLAGR